MDLGIFPPPDRTLHAPGRALLAGNAIGIASLLLPQGLFRNIITFPALFWIANDVRKHGTGLAASNYQDAVDLSMALVKLIDFSVLRVPEESVHHIRPDGRAETTEDVLNMTLHKRFRWGLDLFLTMRGINWDWRVKNVGMVPHNASRR